MKTILSGVSKIVKSAEKKMAHELEARFSEIFVYLSDAKMLIKCFTLPNCKVTK